MSKSSNRIKDILFDCVNSMSENPWIHTDQINHFSRKRKIVPSASELRQRCFEFFYCGAYCPLSAVGDPPGALQRQYLELWGFLPFECRWRFSRGTSAAIS